MMHTWISWVCSPEFLWSWIGLAVVVFIALTRIAAPYGRHGRGGWGPNLPARLAWFLMEAVTLLGFGSCFLLAAAWSWPSLLFFLMYVGHYVYRACIYPWLCPPTAAPVPLSIVIMATVFNLINSSILGGYIFVVGSPLEVSALPVLLGTILFVLGFFAHVRSDSILRRLRADNGPGYHIPKGFLYRWVSCPNYLGEMVQWFGFAFALQSLAGWSFALWTTANLLPRALRHHQWYQDRFDAYPTSRRAIIPGLL